MMTTSWSNFCGFLQINLRVHLSTVHLRPSVTSWSNLASYTSRRETLGNHFISQRGDRWSPWLSSRRADASSSMDCWMGVWVWVEHWLDWFGLFGGGSIFLPGFDELFCARCMQRYAFGIDTRTIPQLSCRLGPLVYSRGSFWKRFHSSAMFEP